MKQKYRTFEKWHYKCRTDQEHKTVFNSMKNCYSLDCLYRIAQIFEPNVLFLHVRIARKDLLEENKYIQDANMK